MKEEIFGFAPTENESEQLATGILRSHGPADDMLVGASSRLPVFTRQVLAQENPSKEDLSRAADEAEKDGYPKLATALRARIGTAKELIPSPWKDVTSAAWTRFTRVISDGHAPSFVNPKGFHGLFQLSVRRLVDLGIMSDPKSKMLRTPDGKTIRVWEAIWVLPRETFFGDPSLQYKLFLRSMELYRSIIIEKYKQVLGLDIDGKIATLSGLLSLAHSAGAEGMRKWLLDSNIRKKFTWVRDIYHKTNGIF